VGHIDIDRRIVDENAGDQRDDVARLIVEIAGFDDGEAGQQGLAFDLRQAVDAGLLNQIVPDSGHLGCRFP
jgi:hypothetical protein